MKVLLDENLPHDLRKLIPGHDVYTVAYMGWSGIQNGSLLSRATAEFFDVMVTGDSGIYYQQNITTIPIAIVILKAKTNKIEDVRPLAPSIISALAVIRPKTILVLK